MTIILMLLMAMACSAAAQEAQYKYDLGGGIGMSGYLGDANTSSLLKHPGLTAEIGARYIPNVRWAFRSLLGFTTLSGNSAEMDNVAPNHVTYSFSSSVFSLDVRGEFNFLPFGIGETYKRLSRVAPYLALGVGVCLASCDGTRAAFTVPMGFGVKYKVNPRLNLVAEFSMTKAFSDKLDGPVLNDLTGIKTLFFKNTDWFSRLTVGLTFEFGKRCQTCNYVD